MIFSIKLKLNTHIAHFYRVGQKVKPVVFTLIPYGVNLITRNMREKQWFYWYFEILLNSSI